MLKHWLLHYSRLLNIYFCCTFLPLGINTNKYDNCRSFCLRDQGWHVTFPNIIWTRVESRLVAIFRMHLWLPFWIYTGIEQSTFSNEAQSILLISSDQKGSTNVYISLPCPMFRYGDTSQNMKILFFWLSAT